MKHKNLVVLSRQYFLCWASKDLGSLENFFSDDVSLLDWNISCLGKKDVLAANMSIFESVENLGVQVKSISQVGSRVFAEIRVKAGEDEIPVVDILEFDEDSKIKSITAYRGN